MNLPYENYLTKERIWCIRQNKPSLVAKDLETFCGVNRKIAHNILLARGVYKWLSVRRDIIKLKNIWKSRITSILSDIRILKKENNVYQLGYARGYLKAYEECRKEIRELCHSDRWKAPDFDKEAQKHLQSFTN